MIDVKNQLENSSVNSDLAMLTVPPDCRHVGKSQKASFAN